MNSSGVSIADALADPFCDKLAHPPTNKAQAQSRLNNERELTVDLHSFMIQSFGKEA
jgi:hypothetical protein